MRLLLGGQRLACANVRGGGHKPYDRLGVVKCSLKRVRYLLASIVAQLELPAFLLGADSIDVEIRGEVADLERVEELGGDRPQVERLVRPATWNLGHDNRHPQMADFFARTNESRVAGSVDCEL